VAATGDVAAADAAFLASLAPEAPSAYHRLNPLTKGVAAIVCSLGAFVLGGYLGPLAILVGGIIPSAIWARLLGRLLRISIILALPVAISVVLVSVFTRAGSTVLLSVGPFDATLEGLDFAGQVLVRLLVLAAAVGLFGLTTDPRALVFDLERRGMSPKVGFAAVATVEAVPAMIERARVPAMIERARGLDTEGRLLARVRGIMPVVGPVLVSSLTEVEERSLALEVRAFGKPGRRNLLWWPAETRAERLVRWALVAGFLGLVAARVAGLLPPIP
jgi:energy-coupling factor transport system permease protein